MSWGRGFRQRPHQHPLPTLPASATSPPTSTPCPRCPRSLPALPASAPCQHPLSVLPARAPRQRPSPAPPTPLLPATTLGLSLLVPLGLLGPALLLCLHVPEHGLREAQVPRVQHACHGVQRGHLVTDGVCRTLGACSESPQPGEERLPPIWEKGRHCAERPQCSQLVHGGPQSMSHCGAAVPKAQTARNSPGLPDQVQAGTCFCGWVSKGFLPLHSPRTWPRLPASARLKYTPEASAATAAF